jgi:hypothetical protein
VPYEITGRQSGDVAALVADPTRLEKAWGCIHGAIIANNIFATQSGPILKAGGSPAHAAVAFRGKRLLLDGLVADAVGSAYLPVAFRMAGRYVARDAQRPVDWACASPATGRAGPRPCRAEPSRHGRGPQLRARVRVSAVRRRA